MTGKLYGSYEVVGLPPRVVIELKNRHGSFAGAWRLDVKPGFDLYDAAYASAVQHAAAKGCELERFSRVEPPRPKRPDPLELLEEPPLTLREQRGLEAEQMYAAQRLKR